MFIEKDTRKIPDILADEKDTREVMKLARRVPEFKGSTRVICTDKAVAAMGSLRYLSCYNNSLERLTDIGNLCKTPIQELNLGRNLLEDIPDEITEVSTLQSLWLDDNKLTSFPEPLLSLRNLTLLRLSNNKVGVVPDGIGNLYNLEELALDNNGIEELPDSFCSLTNLKRLVLRQNKLRSLPAEFGSLVSLEMVNLSTNSLRELPDSIGELKSLSVLFVNKNELETLPASMAEMGSLTKLNIANNSIDSLPEEIIMAWRSSLPEIAAASGLVSTAGETEGAEESKMEGVTKGGVAATETAGIKITINGNPITTDVGYALAASQFSQPLVHTFKRSKK